MQIRPPKDDSGQVWFKLAQWFQRRRFLKKFTDGRRMPSDGNSSHKELRQRLFIMTMGEFHWTPILMDFLSPLDVKLKTR
jgi:hypothetical protein